MVAIKAARLGRGSMNSLTCPRCRKNSYSSYEASFLVCPYCGFKFSKKYGAEKRLEERTKQEIPFTFFYHEENFEGSTLDVSEKGLSVEIFGKPLVTVSDIVGFSIRDSQIKAKVRWVVKLQYKSRMGLQKLN
jgi:DNA-directed RNA polymerase subunit RPC12/RpoP